MYFLDERRTRHLFIDLFIGKKMSGKPINERRAVVLSHLEIHLREDMEKHLIELAKAVAQDRTMRELNDIAKKAKTDEI